MKINIIDGTGYTVYVPNGADANTPVVVSLGTGEDAEIKSEIETIRSQYGEDVIIARISGEDYRLQDIPAWRDSAYAFLKENYDFDGVADVYYATSNRCGQVLNLAADDIKNSGNTVSSPSFALLDGRMASGSNGFDINTLNEEHINYIVDADSKMYFYTTEYNDYNMENINRFVRKGLNCVLIEADLSTPGAGDGHLMQNTANIKNGAIRLSLGLSSQLSNIEKYTFKIPSVDSSGNVSWKPYTWSRLSEDEKKELTYYLESMQTSYHIQYDKNGIYNYYSKVDFSNFKDITTSLKSISDFTNENIVTNDNQFVISDMNAIRGYIRNTNMLDNIASIGNVESTTKVPTCIENILHDYISLITTYLDKLSLESEKVVNVSTMIDDADKEIENETKQIEEIVYVPISSGISGTAAAAPTKVNKNNIDNYLKEKKIKAINEKITKNEEIELQPYDIDKMLNKNISTKLYNITADDLNRLFQHWANIKNNQSSPLLGTGESWIKACEETDLDPLTLIGICGEETGYGSEKGAAWMDKKNFLGMLYVDPTGEGTGNVTMWGGENDLFATTDEAILASAKQIKNFYAANHGGSSIMGLAHSGYTGHSDARGESAINDNFGYMWADIMKQSLDYITGTNGGV